MLLKIKYYSRLLLVLLSSSALHFLQAEALSTNTSITTAAYADFLNSEAITDSLHLYCNMMGSDPQAASILRQGSPGYYRYTAISGRENIPVSYVTKNAAEKYLDWLQTQQQEFDPSTPIDLILEGDEYNTVDDCMSSSQNFYEIIASLNTLSLATEKNVSKYCIESIGTLLAAVAVYLGIREALTCYNNNNPYIRIPESGSYDGRELIHSPSPNNVPIDFSASPPMTEENQLFESKTRYDISIPLDTHEFLNRPTSKHRSLAQETNFRAGTKLRKELSRSAEKFVQESLAKSPGGMRSFIVDLGRAEITLIDKGDASDTRKMDDVPVDLSAVSAESMPQRERVSPEEMILNISNGLEELKKFVAPNKEATPILGSMIHQGLFEPVIAMIQDPGATFSAENFSAPELARFQGVIVTSSPRKDSLIVKYKLEKKPGNLFVLIGTMERNNSFDQKKLSRKETYLLSYEIKMSDSQSNKQGILPCTIECNDFQFSYKISDGD